MSLILTGGSELRFWMTSCGCQKPAIHYSSDFDARVCQNCGTVLVDEQAKADTLDFVHLKVHTHLSFLRATCKIEDLIEKAIEFKMPALAKTEFGNMCGAPSFVKDCVDAGIKPILGTTFDVKMGDMFHPVTFIAMDHDGYKNLVRLNTLAWKVRFGKERGPSISLDDITSSGLLALVGPEQNSAFDRVVDLLVTKLPVTLLASYHGPQDDAGLHAVRAVSQARSLPVVAVNDVLYTRQEEHDAYKVALRIGHHDCLLHEPEYYFKSSEDMAKLPFDDEWYKNSTRIASAVQDYGLINKKFIVPTFKDSNGEWTIEQSHAKLQMDAWNGLYAKGLTGPEYIERLTFELDTIQKKGFSSYFLIIAEIVNFIKRGWLRPVGRGSSVGSLVCYVLDIIAMDPIRWKVPFERFINEGRKDLPDIDTDITQEGRGEVLKHISNIHGHDRVAQIATYQTMGLKAAIDNVGRALDVSFVQNRELRNKISEEADEVDKLSDDVKKELATVKGWADYAKSLTGIARHFGIHAAGIVISNGPLGDLVPLLPEEDGLLGVQYDMKDLEILGLLKLDMLGLRTLDIIQYTLKRIKDNHGVDIDIYNLPPDDAGTYGTISSGDYVSVFQLDSPGYRKLCRQLKPDNYEHIMALNALFRPGPLESGVTGSYVKRRHAQEAATSWHPWLDDVLKPTYNTVLFQEQAMAMARIVAGFNGVEADEFRKGIGKKNIEAVEKSLDKFKNGALKRVGLQVPPDWNGSLESWVDDLIKKLHGYARYMWNIGHSCGYGWITYITAYLEAHYASEYYTSLLDATDKPDKVATLLKGILMKKYAVVPPDINESRASYSNKEQTIYMGMSSVRSVASAADDIIEERNKNGPYASFIEFCQRLPSVNKTAKTNLIKAGAFKWDKMMNDRDKLDNIDIIHKIIRRKNKKFDGSKIPPIQVAMECFITNNDFTDIQKQQNEREVLNSFITGHPAAVYCRLSHSLERKDTPVIYPSMIKDCQMGQTVLLVGMVDSILKKFIIREGANKGKPYLVINISDNHSSILTNIWHPMCLDMEKILAPGQIGLFECTTKPDKFREGFMSLTVKHAIMLTHGMPVQGVFSNNGVEPETVVTRIGGIVNEVFNVGARKYASIRGRITVMPDILESAVAEFGDNVKFLISMESSGG
jgi:DNA polymerase-3 subunit alpha